MDWGLILLRKSDPTEFNHLIGKLLIGPEWENSVKILNF